MTITAKGQGKKISTCASPKVKRIVTNFWNARGMTVSGAIREYVIDPALDEYNERERKKRDGK